MFPEDNDHNRRVTDLAKQKPHDTRRPVPLDVRAVRGKLGFTQRQFAGYFGYSLGALRHWERGSRRPTATALVLLHVIASNPRVVLIAVRKARTEYPGVLPALEALRSSRAPPGMAVPM